MSMYTHNWESVMNLNRMLNIDKKNKEKKKKKKDKKPFFIEIKKQKIKNVFLTTLILNAHKTGKWKILENSYLKSIY